MNGRGRWREVLRQAFAVGDPAPPTAEERALLEDLAQAIARRGLALPARLAAGSSLPMGFVGAQALHFLAPYVELALGRDRAARLAAVLERRDALSWLEVRLEALEAAREAGPAGAPGGPAR